TGLVHRKKPIRVGGGREVQEGNGIYVYLWLIHVDIWQKPPQYCKAIILQLIKQNLKKESRGVWEATISVITPS
ncbi:hypothetical protein, partial [Corynebacterium pyruviciproducens]|uniref:hypothetical protein n=1 Tax=Corynebacterium pyruviciproducens TaxID=598660 RepID=UPI002551792F